MSSSRCDRFNPIHLQFSPTRNGKENACQFSDAVFQSARVLAQQKMPQVREHDVHYPQETPPSIELLFLSQDHCHGVGVTILFSKSGPSVICYEKSKESESLEENLAPKLLQQIGIGYQNRYSYFTLSNVERKFKI